MRFGKDSKKMDSSLNAAALAIIQLMKNRPRRVGRCLPLAWAGSPSLGTVRSPGRPTACAWAVLAVGSGALGWPFSSAKFWITATTI